jgi:hypothetical protein
MSARLAEVKARKCFLKRPPLRHSPPLRPLFTFGLVLTFMLFDPGDVMARVQQLSIELQEELFTALYKAYPDYRIELNNLVFPAEPPTYFVDGAKEFRNALTVWNDHKGSLDPVSRQPFVELVGATRMSFGRSRDDFLKWVTQRTTKIDQTRRALSQ